MGRLGQAAERHASRTLVLHAHDDAVVTIAEGRLLASGIPRSGSSSNSIHGITFSWNTNRPGSDSREEVRGFLQTGRALRESVFEVLSTRERLVLASMADGLSNTEIAERLNISEKTVPNHASNVFDKLGVWSRARDRQRRPAELVPSRFQTSILAPLAARNFTTFGRFL